MVARQVAHRTALPAAEKLGMPAVYSLLAVGANGQVAVRMNVGEGAIDQSAEHVVIGHRKLRGSCPSAWCRSAGSPQVSGGSGRLCQAATAGSLTKGSSLNGAMVSSVM